MAFTNKENRTGLSHPMVQAGITYALLKGAPLLKNIGNLVGNANYATLEAQALMAKGMMRIKNIELVEESRLITHHIRLSK